MRQDTYRVSVLVTPDLEPECPDHLAVEALRISCERKGLKMFTDTFQKARKPDGIVYYVTAQS